MEKLTTKQTKLIEDNINFIYWYCHKNNLDTDDWFGILSLEICQKINKFDESKGTFTTFASMIFDNCVRQEYRRQMAQKRPREVKEFDFTELLKTKEGVKVLDDVESQIYVDQFLTKYADDEIIQLRLEGYNQSEIADIMGISQVKVSRHLAVLKDEFKGGI